jgi:hypothetical protein
MPFVSNHSQTFHSNFINQSTFLFYEIYITYTSYYLLKHISLGTVFEDDAIFPSLINHKGVKKITRLQKLLPSSFFKDGKLLNSHGYTDSTADLPMLGICDKATVVNPKPEFAALAEKSGWTILRPARPWKSPSEKIWRVFLLVLALGKNPIG